MLWPVLSAIASLVAAYLFRALHHKRFKQYASLPQLPSSFLWGHMRAFDDWSKRGQPDRHPDYVFEEMYVSLGRPPVMVIDLWPVMYPVALITNHEVAEQITKPSPQFPTSVLKSPTVSHIMHLIGEHTILAKPDEEWKRLRKRFNPGFAPQYLLTFLPCIMDKSVAFIELLDRLAATDEVFSLTRATTNLTFDIIGGVVMDLDLQAQFGRSQQGELIQLYSELLETYTDDKNNVPWWLAPRTEMKRRRLAKRIDDVLDDAVRRKFAEHKNQAAAAAQPSKSVLALSFQDVDDLTPHVLGETRDQLKTFMFAGHDTTSILLSWIFYELSRTPRVLRKVRAELDELLGTDPSPAAVRAKLLSPERGGEDLVRRMVYVSAVIKEGLRLHAPAGTARMARPGAGFVVTAPSGERYCLDGTVLYVCPSIIQRDPAVYGATADDFVPERWLADGGDDGGSIIPASAWRPFERGPRNCIGQELANIEARVIIALVARQYDFVKVGLGELLLDETTGRPVRLEGDAGRYQVKSELYNTRQVTSKPADGMMMKVRRVGS